MKNSKKKGTSKHFKHDAPSEGLQNPNPLTSLSQRLSPPRRVEISMLMPFDLKLSLSMDYEKKQSKANGREEDSITSSKFSVTGKYKTESLVSSVILANPNNITKAHSNDMNDQNNQMFLSVIKNMCGNINGHSEYNSLELDVATDDLNYLDSLYLYLVAIFENRFFDVKLPELDPSLEKVLWAILDSKLLRNRNNPKILVQKQSKDLLDVPELLQKSCEKRLEECFKFVMPKMFKKLKKKFALIYPAEGNSDDRLYEHYFGDLSVSMGQSLTQFHYPQHNRSGQIAFPISYFKKIFKSRKFREEFNDWIDNFAWKDYKSKVEKKLHQVVCEWDKKIQNKPHSKQEILMEMAEKFRKPNKPKLPWTKYELIWALDKIKTSID